MFLFLPSSPGCSLSSIEHVWKKGAIVGTRAWLWPVPRNSHDLLKVLLTTLSTEDRNGSCAGALGKPPIAQAGQQTTKAETIKRPSHSESRMHYDPHLLLHIETCLTSSTEGIFGNTTENSFCAGIQDHPSVLPKIRYKQ